MQLVEPSGSECLIHEGLTRRRELRRQGVRLLAAAVTAAGFLPKTTGSEDIAPVRQLARLLQQLLAALHADIQLLAQLLAAIGILQAFDRQVSRLESSGLDVTSRFVEGVAALGVAPGPFPLLFLDTPAESLRVGIDAFHVLEPVQVR